MYVSIKKKKQINVIYLFLLQYFKIKKKKVLLISTEQKHLQCLHNINMIVKMFCEYGFIYK